MVTAGTATTPRPLLEVLGEHVAQVTARRAAATAHRKMDDILAEGRVRAAELLAASRAGNTAEVDRIHQVINDLTKEAAATWRAETTTEEHR